MLYIVYTATRTIMERANDFFTGRLFSSRQKCDGLKQKPVKTRPDNGSLPWTKSSGNYVVWGYPC